MPNTNWFRGVKTARKLIPPYVQQVHKIKKNKHKRPFSHIFSESWGEMVTTGQYYLFTVKYIYIVG